MVIWYSEVEPYWENSESDILDKLAGDLLAENVSHYVSMHLHAN